MKLKEILQTDVTKATRFLVAVFLLIAFVYIVQIQVESSVARNNAREAQRNIGIRKAAERNVESEQKRKTREFRHLLENDKMYLVSSTTVNVLNGEIKDYVVLDGADSKTFEYLGYGVGQDDQNVYYTDGYRTKVFKGASAQVADQLVDFFSASDEIYGRNEIDYYFYDENQYWYHGLPLSVYPPVDELVSGFYEVEVEEGAKGIQEFFVGDESFVQIGGRYYKSGVQIPSMNTDTLAIELLHDKRTYFNDGERVYFISRFGFGLLEGAVPGITRAVGDPFIVNGSNVYTAYSTEPDERFDGATLEEISKNYYKDVNIVIYQRRHVSGWPAPEVIEGADPDNFRPLENQDTSVSGANVYWRSELAEGVDGNTVEILSEDYLRDAHHVFFYPYNGGPPQMLEGADRDSIVALGGGLARDKNHTWKWGRLEE